MSNFPVRSMGENMEGMVLGNLVLLDTGDGVSGDILRGDEGNRLPVAVPAAALDHENAAMLLNVLQGNSGTEIVVVEPANEGICENISSPQANYIVQTVPKLREKEFSSCTQTDQMGSLVDASRGAVSKSANMPQGMLQTTASTVSNIRPPKIATCRNGRHQICVSLESEAGRPATLGSSPYNPGEQGDVSLLNSSQHQSNGGAFGKMSSPDREMNNVEQFSTCQRSRWGEFRHLSPRERNRQAQRRFRERQKSRVRELQREVQRLNGKVCCLQSELGRAQEEKERLVHAVANLMQRLDYQTHRKDIHNHTQ